MTLLGLFIFLSRVIFSHLHMKLVLLFSEVTSFSKHMFPRLIPFGKYNRSNVADFGANEFVYEQLSFLQIICAPL